MDYNLNWTSADWRIALIILAVIAALVLLRLSGAVRYMPNDRIGIP